MASILWISWKDTKHPEAGGAERVTHEIRKRLINEGHSVTLLTSSFAGSLKNETTEGVEIIRTTSNKFLLIFSVVSYYLRKEKNKHDIIIEEVNTTPFLLQYFKGRETVFLLYHQLTGIVWDYETHWPLNILGKLLLEPIALFLQRITKPKVIAMSTSTKNDLQAVGFDEDKISVIPEATNSLIEFIPFEKKNEKFTIAYFGNLRAMKRPEEVLHIFARAYKKEENLRLVIAGSGTSKRIESLRNLAEKLRVTEVTSWHISPTDNDRNQLLKKVHLVCMTSVKEGWGTVITEAGKLGTPGLVYDVDGLRDAVAFGETGFLIQNNNIEEATTAILKAFNDREYYESLQLRAFDFNKKLVFDNTYDAFKKVVCLS